MRDEAELMLTEMRQRVERWRGKSGGGRGSRIPEDLWEGAAEVAQRVGVYTTARALRLNYERLKARVAEARARRRSDRSVEAGFVELPMGSLTAGRILVELVGSGGEQMRIHLTGAGPAELVGLAQTFWSRRS